MPARQGWVEGTSLRHADIGARGEETLTAELSRLIATQTTGYLGIDRHRDDPSWEHPTNRIAALIHTLSLPPPREVI